ncbi:hypothetical protein BpHYR1_036915 [Brachionus plicatilis]|uniref:Uncharacterized protein n=1 Tax=Brachionus plicatilis TaxID=10195 RepID=A0A3M7QKZ3_BRAPC|nr:hypothetical protein BpHYR1_036915 [Brachionus plicatilis]
MPENGMMKRKRDDFTVNPSLLFSIFIMFINFLLSELFCLKLVSLFFSVVELSVSLNFTCFIIFSVFNVLISYSFSPNSVNNEYSIPALHSCLHLILFVLRTSNLRIKNCTINCTLVSSDKLNNVTIFNYRHCLNNAHIINSHFNKLFKGLVLINLKILEIVSYPQIK